MSTETVSVVLVLGLLLPAFAAKDQMKLNLDFSGKQTWRYAVDYHAECVFDEAGTTSRKKTDLSCVLNGTLSGKKDAVVFNVANLGIKGGLLDQEAKAKMEEALTQKEYTLPLENGYPAVEGLVDLSSEGLPEWNVYMQFAKLLPELPGGPAKKGLTWERTGTLDIDSPHGKIPCEVYRSFKVDRISAAKDTAYISWKFSYGATKPVEDQSTLLRYVPVAGKGNGAAVVQVTEGFIVSAEMDFESPVAEVGKAKVTWKETAALRFVQAK